MKKIKTTLKNLTTFDKGSIIYATLMVIVIVISLITIQRLDASIQNSKEKSTFWITQSILYKLDPQERENYNSASDTERKKMLVAKYPPELSAKSKKEFEEILQNTEVPFTP